jgi:hypothetical protein
MGERSALNFAQRMSGIATLARRYVGALPAGAKTRIADTRKTTPGLRSLERYAVRTGGAHNHRDTLGSAVLIKANHIEAAGGITTRSARRAYAPHTSRIGSRWSRYALDEALAAGAEIVMLDNFAPAEIRRPQACRAKGAIVDIRRHPLERIAELARRRGRDQRRRAHAFGARRRHRARHRAARASRRASVATLAVSCARRESCPGTRSSARHAPSEGGVEQIAWPEHRRQNQ